MKLGTSKQGLLLRLKSWWLRRRLRRMMRVICLDIVRLKDSNPAGALRVLTQIRWNLCHGLTTGIPEVDEQLLQLVDAVEIEVRTNNAFPNF